MRSRAPIDGIRELLVGEGVCGSCAGRRLSVDMATEPLHIVLQALILLHSMGNNMVPMWPFRRMYRTPEDPGDS